MAACAAEGLLRYLSTHVPGLWYDCQLPSGEFVVEPASAGNFYHIVGAIHELAAVNRVAGFHPIC
jgi:mannose/cellobiose epimerase-like protein (N-acyl-D-glucosamine 2-epimerase family)